VSGGERTSSGGVTRASISSSKSDAAPSAQRLSRTYGSPTSGPAPTCHGLMWRPLSIPSRFGRARIVQSSYQKTKMPLVLPAFNRCKPPPAHRTRRGRPPFSFGSSFHPGIAGQVALDFDVFTCPATALLFAFLLLPFSPLPNPTFACSRY
jgi:hypothetical protein